MIRKGRPWRPARFWEKRAGPRESTRTASAITSRSGLSTISPTAESPMSSTRFMAMVDHDVPQVPYSITGISAMWESRTAVPSIALMGGITLSLTPVTRQTETTRASVASSSSGTASTTRWARDSVNRYSRSARLSWSTPSSCSSEPFSALGPGDLGDREMVAGLEGELARDRVGELAAAQHQRPLGRHQAAPERPGRGAQAERAGQGHHVQGGGAVDGERHVGQRPDQEQGPRHRQGDPVEHGRHLVGGEMPDLRMVGVVEALELRDHHPEREGRQRPQRTGRALDEGHRPDGKQEAQDIGCKKQSAAEGVLAQTRAPTRLSWRLSRR